MEEVHRPDLYITEQCIKWNFTGVQKALHCDMIMENHAILWRFTKVSLMRVFHRKIKCSVVVDGHLSEWFPVKSGVPQGCIVSPILFVVTNDWIMWKTTADRPRGIQ